MINIKGAVIFPSGNADKINVTYNNIDETGQVTSSLKRASLAVSDDNIKAAIKTLETFIDENVEVG